MICENPDCTHDCDRHTEQGCTVTLAEDDTMPVVRVEEGVNALETPEEGFCPCWLSNGIAPVVVP